MKALARVLGVPDTTNRQSMALLLVRVAFGAMMATHGLGKIKNPLHWMDKAARPAPAILQAAAAVSEFCGGIAIAVGLLTPVAAAGIIATMGVAIYTHKAKGDSLLPSPGKGTYELALLYLVSMVTLVVAGPGKYSIDAFLFGRRR